MFAKITIALALIVGSASGALAATKHNANRTYDDWQAYDLYYGQHSGSAARVKTTHAKTARAATTHVKAARETTQVAARQIEAVQVQAGPVAGEPGAATH